jgi:hypothetical protein
MLPPDGQGFAAFNQLLQACGHQVVLSDQNPSDGMETEDDTRAFGDAMRKGAAMIRSLRPEDWAALAPTQTVLSHPQLNPEDFQ